MILTLFVSTFITVFVAELGDKTQLATIALSGTSNRPFAVFLGSATALVLSSLLGALAGGSLSNLISRNILESVSSIIFLYIGIRLIINSLNQTISQDSD